jgi:hypothetical protein
MSRIVSAYQPFDNSEIVNQMARQYGYATDESEPPKPLSDEEIEQKVDAYRAELQARWGSSKDYLAGVAWPGLRFRLQNEENGFLTNVEVVLTFHGARRVDYDHIEGFEWNKLEDPSRAADTRG